MLIRSLLFAASLSALLPAQTIRFTHGRWFDGTGFVAADRYSVDGVLSSVTPTLVDQTVDLHDGYVVPPFGDAHEHNFDTVAVAPAVTARYLTDGIFYAQGVTDVTSGAREVLAAHLVDTPSTVDVTYAHGGLTGVDGHPKEVYESLAMGFYYPANDQQRQQVRDSHRQAGQAYWEIDSPAVLAAEWPKILATRPDLIKVYLSNSEHYTPEMHLHPPFAAGLDPALVPLIVERAHAAGLKVAAHVESTADVHLALVSGVDELAHLPGYCIGDSEDPGKYRLDDADIALAVRLHTAIIPTASICDGRGTTPAASARVRTLERDNLGRLKAAGANLLIGSDAYSQDSLHEATYLHSLELWSNLELLRIWAVATPRDIVQKRWPNRRIGSLAPGYEASFLVLAANPLDDWAATGHITQRWKQGHAIVLTPETR